MKKKSRKLLVSVCVAAGVVLVVCGSFAGYVHHTKNPQPLVPSREDALRFERVCQELYPRPLVRSLPYPVSPAQLEIHSGSAILIDAANGCVLYEKNADEIIPPASMTKLVVMYVVFQEVATGRISLDDVVPLPPESWAVNAPPMSSLMFLGEGQTVTLRELLLGLAVASGNDAAVAVAHYVSGSVDSFVQRMNDEMEKLGLVHTRFVEPSGYSELNLTTAREFAAFARVYVGRYPEALELFHSQPSISYPQEHNLAEWHKNGGQEQPIFQASTNKLLGVLPGCDGLKTGFIFESGYNLSLTAKRGGTRFISVTMRGPGQGSVEGNRYRVADGTTLMEWAFGCFASRPPEKLGAYTLPVLGGKRNSVAVAPVAVESLTVPAILEGKTPSQSAAAVVCSVHLPDYVEGAIATGDVVGKAVYSLAGVTLLEVPLAAVSPVERGSWLKRALDTLAELFLM